MTKARVAGTIMIALMTLLLVQIPVTMASDEDHSSLDGKKATWAIDSDMDGDFDTVLTMSNVRDNADAASQGSGNSAACDLNVTVGTGTFSLLGSNLTWEGIDLVAPDNDSLSEGGVILVAGIARNVRSINCTFNGTPVTLHHERTTLLIVSAITIQDNGTGIEFMKIENTDAFFTASTAGTTMIVASIILAIILVIYVTSIVVAGRVRKNKRACFDPSCMES
jgi:hypothetical protein